MSFNDNIFNMTKFKNFLIILFLFLAGLMNAQVGVGTKTPNSDAMLEVRATNKGLLLPRIALVSSTVASPLSAHVAGMIVYNTATVADLIPGYYYNDGVKWLRLNSEVVTDATTTSKGVVQLSGDLGGSALSPTIAANAVTYSKLQNISNNNIILGRATTGSGVVEEITLGNGLSLTGTTLNASAAGDLRLVNTLSHISQDAGVGSNGTNAGGTNVIAIGSQSGNSNTGGNNVFVGSRTGYSNTSGIANTFIGHLAGELNTTGEINTFIGNWSGKSNTTGNNNVFMGHFSGGHNTIGNSNTFIGHETGSGNTSGLSNTALGTFALKSSQTSNYNTSIGMESLKVLNNGEYNTSLGYQSGLNLTSASNNTLIGTSALLYTTTGNLNIALGRNAGENITTGSNNIAIGNSSLLPSATDDNQLNIGNIIYGNNIDGTGANLSTGNIGIGIKTPSEKLDINGNLKFSGALLPNNSAGSAGQVLTSGGAGVAPTWVSPLAVIKGLVDCSGTITQTILDSNVTNNSAIVVTYEDTSGDIISTTIKSRVVGTSFTIQFGSIPPTSAKINYIIVP
jgi:hypothetical protein